MQGPRTQTELAALIQDEIARLGPIPFSRFMELALYTPGLGYYARARDPFGRAGDFFTASQLQPVFGRLIGAAVDELFHQLGEPSDFTVVELGSGRGEMARAFEKYHYIPIEHDSNEFRELPPDLTGVVFSNEFFDALPVDVIAQSAMQDGACEQRVDFANGRFLFVDGPKPGPEIALYLARFGVPESLEQRVVEIHRDAVQWMRSIAETMKRGYVLTIDYGYLPAEAVRFPHGTLMSYRGHRASENILAGPGNQDITSHVPFGILRRAGEESGLRIVSIETLARFLASLGERGHFPAAIEGGHTAQLKTLLFEMGEKFRVLLQEKTG